MVEVTYGEQYEAVDLAGMSLAEVQERYREEFGIPEGAKAYLNGKEVGKDLELGITLSDDDRLSFEARRRRKGLILVRAFLLAILVITVAQFAYTYTTDSIMAGVTAYSGVATVEPTSLLASFSTDIFGGFSGDIPTGSLFEITPDFDYTGDLMVKVYLTNIEELRLAYQHLNVELELHDADGNNLHASETGHTSEMLSLDNGVVTFSLNHPSGAYSPYKIYLAGGFKRDLRNSLDWPRGYDGVPLLLCEVTQR